jgi:tetratricopeptide (TPR) repeat protein
MAIKGSLKEASLPDVVQLLFLGRRTGCLSVANERNFASVWFDDGWIVFAGMVSRPDRLGERLVAAGKLTPAQLDEAIAAQQAVPGRRLGELLVQLGMLLRTDLEAELQRQIEETVYTLFTWTSGTFSFEAGVRPEDVEATLRLNPEGLLLEGARRIDEWSVIAKKITSFDAVYALDDYARPEGVAEPQLVEIERRIAPLVDGARSVRDLVDATGLTDFEVCRVLFGLLSAGRLRRVATAAAAAPRQDAARIDEHRNLGVAFYRTGMLAEAEREFRRVAEILPSDAAAPFQLGLIALRQGHWDDACEHFRVAAERQAPRGPVLHNLALGLEAMGRLDQADAALADAVAHHDGDARLWTAWGMLALKQGDPSRARQRFARAREMVPEGVPPAHWFWGYGWSRALSDDWNGALSTLHDGVTAYPDHPVLRTTLAVLLEGTGDVAEAESHLRHALGQDPTIPQTSKNLGDLLYHAGRWDEAEEAYQRAAQLAPGLGDDVYFKLGNLACRRGDLPSARRHWEEALVHNPEHALARANLAGSGTQG